MRYGPCVRRTDCRPCAVAQSLFKSVRLTQEFLLISTLRVRVRRRDEERSLRSAGKSQNENYPMKSDRNLRQKRGIHTTEKFPVSRVLWSSSTAPSVSLICTTCAWSPPCTGQANKIMIAPTPTSFNQYRDDRAERAPCPTLSGSTPRSADGIPGLIKL